jgi:hypothetical protein
VCIRPQIFKILLKSANGRDQIADLFQILQDYFSMICINYSAENGFLLKFQLGVTLVTIGDSRDAGLKFSYSVAIDIFECRFGPHNANPRFINELKIMDNFLVNHDLAVCFFAHKSL